jgi:hypothetical protein
MIAAEKSYAEFNVNTREITFSRITAAFGIDGNNHPVLLLNGDVRVIATNAKARSFLSRKQSEIYGRPICEVIGCAQSKKRGISGETFGCLSCAMRQSIQYSMVTGEECLDVPVCPSRDAKTQLLVSTKKVFDYVFLTLRDIHDLTMEGR